MSTPAPMTTTPGTEPARRAPRMPSRIDTPVRRIGFGRLVRAEMRKATDTRASRWMFGLFGVLTLVVLAIDLFTGQADDKSFQSFIGDGSGLMSMLVLPIIGILVVTSEWSQRTGLVTFSMEPRRFRVALAKLLAACLIGLAVIVVTIGLAALATLLADVVRGGHPTWSLKGTALLGTVLALLINVAMGVAFGLILQSTPFAITLYLVLPTAWTFLGLTVPALKTPAQWLDTGQTLEPLMNGKVGGEQWAQLATSIGVWVALPLLLGLWRLHRSEVK